MSESKFKQLQKDACYKSPDEILEEIQEPDKICPTCIPNPNYIEPDWTQTEEPYLNEKQCEYQVKMMINIDADIYYDGADELESVGSDTSNNSFKKLSNSPYPFPKVLLKSYIRPAVRKMLRFFNKIDSDEIVCAAPPPSPGQPCKSIFGLDYESYITREDQVTDSSFPDKFEITNLNKKAIETLFTEIENREALELFARVKDYSFTPVSKILIVHIGIPAYKFDAVPNTPDLGSLNTSVDQVVIRPPDFMNAMDRFQRAMNTFKTFQSYFHKQENGKLYFEKSGNPFYITFYANTRIQKFIDKLDTLLDKNKFNLRGFLDTGTQMPGMAYEVEVSFDNSDENKPFVVKNVRARKANCPYV